MSNKDKYLKYFFFVLLALADYVTRFIHQKYLHQAPMDHFWIFLYRYTLEKGIKLKLMVIDVWLDCLNPLSVIPQNGQTHSTIRR